MKAELHAYQSLIETIKPLEQRKDAEGNDTFSFEAWWCMASEKIPNVALCLRVVGAYPTNSCAPERVFSILNNSFGDDQQSAYADYKAASVMLQFNLRGRERGA